MKSARIYAIAILLVALAVLLAVRLASLNAESKSDVKDVGIVFDPADLTDHPAIRAAIDQVFTEEGIPHEWISDGDVTLMDSRTLERRFSTLFLPDGLNGGLTADATQRIADYARGGGDVAIVYDAATRGEAGASPEARQFEAITGVRYGPPTGSQDSRYDRGALQFADEATALRWHVPPGKVDSTGVVTGYGYGRLVFPLASSSVIDAGATVVAHAGSDPVLSVRPLEGGGNALWCALPVGALAANGDELPLRLLAEGFVEDVGQMPHLVAAPGGVGALVFNWHVDGIIDVPGIELIMRDGIADRSVPDEIDVAAGPDENVLGDRQGFDACGRGEKLLREFAKFGSIGSHGGWDHNIYADDLMHGRLTPARVEDVVRENTDCLRRATGQPVTTYASPVGVHPQPMLTNVLDDLHMVAYYYTGDNGGPPELPFFADRLVSKTVWAVPVMPNGRLASLGEMGDSAVAPATVALWLGRTASFVETQRTIRLVYSHPHDLIEHPEYVPVLKGFVSRLASDSKLGGLQLLSLAQVASFMQRFSATDMRVTHAGLSYSVALDNPAGLERIAFAVPAAWGPQTLPASVRQVSQTNGWRVLAVTQDVTHVNMNFTRSAP